MPSVLTFKNGFEELTLVHKSLIFINDNLIDLGQISLKIYKYKSDLEVALLFYNKTVSSLSSNTSLPNVWAYTVFIDIAIKNKTMYK